MSRNIQQRQGKIVQRFKCALRIKTNWQDPVSWRKNQRRCVMPSGILTLLGAHLSCTTGKRTGLQRQSSTSSPSSQEATSPFSHSLVCSAKTRSSLPSATPCWGRSSMLTAISWKAPPINVTLRYASRRHAPRCLRFHPSRAGAPSSKPSHGRPHHQHCLGSVAKNFLHRRDEDTHCLAHVPASTFLCSKFCSTQSSGPILQSSISSRQVITCLLHITSAFFLRCGISARLILWFGERTLQEP